MNEQQRYDMKVGGTIKVSRKIKDYLPLIAFVFLSVLSIVLYHIWFNPEELSHVADAKEMAAVFYLFPLGCICGAAAVLYALESLSVIRIRRNQTISTILLSVIGLFMLWAVLTIAANNKGCQLLGEAVQSFIDLFPNEMFPESFVYLHASLFTKYTGVLLCEFIGMLLFAALGKKAPLYEEINVHNSLNRYVPLMIISLLFVLTLVLYYEWLALPPKPTIYPDKNLVYRVAASVYLRPLCMMMGSAAVFYISELIGIIKIKRNKVVECFLLVGISLVLLWMVLAFAADTYREVGLLGRGIRRFILCFPDWFFPRGFGFWHGVNSGSYTGVIIYEVLGIGLFSAIGRKDT